ncbi:MAG: hypothetical protein GY903_24920 [Fuerstiella sp.]|nr:hypothetical protein [Fuerstiella sp.]MCP4857739.1 hypothetical protein [Fuerstiella sp.]
MNRRMALVTVAILLLTRTLCCAQEGAEVTLEESGETSFRIRTGEYTLAYEPESRDDKQGWIMIRRDGKANGLATKMASGHHLDVTDLGAGESAAYTWQTRRKDSAIFRSLKVVETEDVIRVTVDSERRWAKFNSTLVVYKEHPGLIHWRVDAKARRDQTFSNAARPDCHFARDDAVGIWGGVHRDAVRYHVQRGPTSGILYFRDPDMASFVFYFEDLSSMNKLYQLTGSAVPYDYYSPGNGGSVRMGQATSKFQRVSNGPAKPYQDAVTAHSSFGYEHPQNFRVPKGTELTFTDTYLYLKPASKTDNVSVSRNFVESLADIYKYIYKPPTIETDWVGEVMPQLLDDVMRPENMSRYQGEYFIPKAYVQYKHDDNQLWTLAQILHPLELYVKKHPADAKAKKLRDMLNDALPAFFNKKHGWIHNNAGDTHTDAYYHTVYVFNPANMVMDLALLGNAHAKTMIAGCRANFLKLGRNLDYTFGDVHIGDFSKSTGHYQFDATGMYIDLMMNYYALSGGRDTEALESAKNAAAKIENRCFDLGWQINMTVTTALGCAKIYQATGDEKYLNLSYIGLASALIEVWLWECDFGVGEYTTTFWSMSGCPAAPSNAEYETSRARLVYRKYEKLVGRKLSPNVQELIGDAWRRGPTQSRFTLPPYIVKAGGKQFIAEEGKEETNCGVISHEQMIPLEDVSAGWGTDLEWFQNSSKLGVVGQEIYGVGGMIWYALWQDE